MRQAFANWGCGAAVARLPNVWFGHVSLIDALVAIVGLVSLLQAAPASAASCSEEGNFLIRVERLQEGFAGRTGERTSIAEDGCFTVDRLLNGNVITRLRLGRLGPDQILSARAAIDATGVASLPDRTGNPPAINLAVVSITYRGVTKELVMPAGADPKDVAALGDGRADDPSVRLARLAVHLLELTGS